MAARGAKIYHIGIKPLGIGEQYFQVPTLDPFVGAFAINTYSPLNSILYIS